MQQFQDDILRTKHMVVEIEQKLISRIESLEEKVAGLEKIIEELSASK